MSPFQGFSRLIKLTRLIKLPVNSTFLKKSSPASPVLWIHRNFLTSKNNLKTSGKSRIYKIGLTCAIGLIAAYEAYTRLDVRKMLKLPNRKESQLQEDQADFGKLSLPDINPTRKVTGPLNDLGLTFTLYQFESCPFCCKVRAFLEYYGIPFNVVEVHPLLKREMNFSKTKKVPLLLVSRNDECEILTESSLVISVLATFLLNPSKGLEHARDFYAPVEYVNEEVKVQETPNKYFLMYEESFSSERYLEIAEERKWRRWVDNELVHFISPNIYRTFGEAKETFHRFSDRGHWDIIFTSFERNLAIYSGAIVMYVIGKRLASKYNLDKDVRKSLYNAGNEWMAAIGDKKPFLGGDYPNLADLAVYGVLNAMEGCQAFEDMFRETKIGPWYNSMKMQIVQHNGNQFVPSKRSKTVT